MNIELKINSLRTAIKKGENVSLLDLTKLETELEASDVKNKDILKNQLYLIKNHLYPTKTPTKWELFLIELGLKENINVVMQLAMKLDNAKNLTLSLSEVNELEKMYELALPCLNDEQLFTEAERTKTIREFQKKIKVFHNRLEREIDAEFCAFLKKTRLELGYSLKDLEDMTGISSSHIHRIENNNRKPSIRIIEKLSKALNIPSNQFLEKMNLSLDKRELIDIIEENHFLINGKTLNKKENKRLKKHFLEFFK